MKNQVQVLNIIKYILWMMAVVKFPLAILLGPLVKNAQFTTYETVANILTLTIMIHQYF